MAFAGPTRLGGFQMDPAVTYGPVVRSIVEEVALLAQWQQSSGGGHRAQPSMRVLLQDHFRQLGAMNSLNAELAQMKADNSGLQSAQMGMAMTIQYQGGVIETLECEARQARQKLLVERQHLAAMQGLQAQETERLNAQLAAEKAANRALQAETQAAEARAAEQAAALEALRAQAAQAERHQEEFEALRAQAERRQEELEAAKQALAKFAEEMPALQAKHQALQAQLEAAHSQRAMASECAQMQAFSAAKAATAHSSSLEKIKALESEVELLQIELRAAKEDADIQRNAFWTLSKKQIEWAKEADVADVAAAQHEAYEALQKVAELQAQLELQEQDPLAAFEQQKQRMQQQHTQELSRVKEAAFSEGFSTGRRSCGGSKSSSNSSSAAPSRHTSSAGGSSSSYNNSGYNSSGSSRRASNASGSYNGRHSSSSSDGCKSNGFGRRVGGASHHQW